MMHVICNQYLSIAWLIVHAMSCITCNILQPCEQYWYTLLQGCNLQPCYHFVNDCSKTDLQGCYNLVIFCNHVTTLQLFCNLVTTL